MEILQTFGVDWRLLLAQIINFFALLYILRRFAYKPILKILEERRQSIEQGIADSVEAKKKLLEVEQREKEVLREAQISAQRIINQAEAVANKNKEEIISNSKNQAAEILRNAEKKIEEEKNKMLSDIKKEAADLVIAATGKLIDEKLDKEKDKKIIEKILQA